MTAQYNMVVLYKKGTLNANGIRSLRKAGYTCVAVNGLFSEVQFRMAGGIGFEDDMGDMQLMILKAALDTYGFGDKLGVLMKASLQAKVDAKAKKVTK